MIQKIWQYITPMIDNVTFSFWASFVTALLRPQDQRLKTVKVAVATTILGTLVGVSIQNIEMFTPFKYAIITLVGLFGSEIYEFLSQKMKNPLAFFREIRKGKENDQN
jgi:hypothetical protein